jgi:GcrA cell cycle regulator
LDKSKDNKMELSNWAPEHSDALREFIAKGLSFSEAAQAINSRFNTSYSRNAALGRARRLGLGSDDRRQPSMPVKPADLHDIAESRASDSRTSTLVWPVPLFKESKPLNLRCVEIEPRHLSVIELERDDCRYPYGGDEENEAITFCGHPRRLGSAYCTPHFHLSRNPVPPERAMSSVVLRVVGGDMRNADVNANATSVADRLKRLPRRHRIAHLRALTGLEPEACDRRHVLSELLGEEISDAPVE